VRRAGPGEPAKIVHLWPKRSFLPRGVQSVPVRDGRGVPCFVRTSVTRERPSGEIVDLLSARTERKDRGHRRRRAAFAARVLEPRLRITTDPAPNVPCWGGDRRGRPPRWVHGGPDLARPPQSATEQPRKTDISLLSHVRPPRAPAAVARPFSDSDGAEGKERIPTPLYGVFVRGGCPNVNREWRSLTVPRSQAAAHGRDPPSRETRTRNANTNTNPNNEKNSKRETRTRPRHGPPTPTEIRVRSAFFASRAHLGEVRYPHPWVTRAS